MSDKLIATVEKILGIRRSKLINFDISSKGGLIWAGCILLGIIVVYYSIYRSDKAKKTEIVLAGVGAFLAACIPFALNKIFDDSYEKAKRETYDNWHIQAKFDIDQKEYASANNILNFLVRDNPNNDSYKLSYAKSLFESNRRNSAEERLMSISESGLEGGEVDEYNYYFGRIYESKHTEEDYKKAIEYYRKVSKDSDKYFLAQTYIGLVYKREQKKYEEAKAVFEALLKASNIKNKDEAYCEFQLAEILFELKDYDVSEKMAKAAIKDDKNCYYTHLSNCTLGKIYLKKKEFDEALSCFNKARDVKEGKYYESYITAAELHLELRDNPQNPVLYSNLGGAYIRCELYPEAIEALEKAMEYDTTENAIHRFNLGSAFLLNKESKKAHLYLSAALNSDPTNETYKSWAGVARCLMDTEEKDTAGSWTELGEAYSGVQMYAEAIGAFKKSLERQNSLRTHYLLGKAYLNHGDYFEALSEFESVYEKDKDFEEVKDYKEIAFYENMLNHNPKNQVSRFKLGNLYFERGSYEMAKKHFERLKEVEPENPEYSNMLQKLSNFQN